MQPLAIIIVLILYFGLVFLIARITNKNATNESFFIGERKSPWYLVAFGMIGASLSGITFISVPGWVGSSQFSYMQMVLGYVVGYFIIATVLMPLYYRLNLISIYTYLEQRFGFWTYKTGAFFFLLSRTMGAAFRLYLVANVLQIAVFEQWGVPYVITVFITILLIWLYTFQGGIKTIVWTDAFQTIFMLLSAGITFYLISKSMDWSVSDAITSISNSEYSKSFFWDWSQPNHFIKQFLSGAFIAIVMTGLDQDMMQKNLSCKNIKEAQINMFSFSAVLVVVNLMFLCLGAALFLFAQHKGIPMPEKSDDLFPLIALNYLTPIAAILFIVGLIAAAYSSADSALTALTTSFCIDFLNFDTNKKSDGKKTRFKVHVGFSVLLLITIMIFREVSDDSVISTLFKAAGYTYGPLLGLYAFGLFTKREIKDNLVPIICVVCPCICLLLNYNSENWFNGYKFGYELLILNGILTFLGLLLVNKKKL